MHSLEMKARTNRYLFAHRPPNDDFSPISVTKISDFVYLNLYDEVSSHNSSSTSVDQEANVSKCERRWLVSLFIQARFNYVTRN